MKNLTLGVNKKNYADTTILQSVVPTQEELDEGQVVLCVKEFSFTANNITYAAMGETLRYWEFFPTEQGQGVIPVWGFADVIASRCEGVEVGEKFYGYYPMATHVVVEPTRISKASFIDGVSHRQPLSLIYNQYIRCSEDPLYTSETEALQMLLRPLFTTSFLLDDFFADNEFFAAQQLVLTSASSKTALGMAFLLNHNRKDRDQAYKIIGLTSSANKTFVEGLGCYDQVATYDELAQIDSTLPTAIVDFAGNGQLLGQLHALLADRLTYSCLVGASHWDQRAGLTKDLAGPKPIMFFAPSQAEKRIKEWGGPLFQTKLAKVWQGFIDFVGGWVNIEKSQGVEEVKSTYQNVLAGKLDPKEGHIVSMW